MINDKNRCSLFLIALFTAFWIFFAIFYGINQKNKKSGDFPKIIKRGVIRVCGEEDLFSFYTDEKGSHGFHYELAKAFSDKYDLDLEYTCESNFRIRLKALRSGKCDIISGPLPVIAEFRNVIAYTEPILESKLVLVQRDKNHNDGIRPIRDQILLRGKKLAVTSHSPNILRIHNLANEISDSIHISQYLVYKNGDLIKAVSNGDIDFAACDKYVANSYLKKYPDIDTKTSLGFTQFQAWAVQPEKKVLLDSLNRFISEYKNSPAFAKLLKKYSRQNPMLMQQTRR